MQHDNDRFAVYRSVLHRKGTLPLEIRSVGRYGVDPEWWEAPRRKHFHQLFWTFEGRGTFRVGRTVHEVGPGDLFLYRPGDLHTVRALSPRWGYCWMTWDHPEAGRWLGAFGLRGRVHRRGPCPQWLFDEAAEGLRLGLPDGTRRASQAAYAVLLETTVKPDTRQSSNRLAEQARAHIDAHFTDVSLTMETVAAAFAVHRTTLFRAFQDAYGLTPSGYLHHRRLQTGLTLLHRSALRVREAAREAGFADPNYFARAVRKAIGSSPRAFRDRFRHKGGGPGSPARPTRSAGADG